MLTEPFDVWPRVAAAAARKALVSFGLPLGGGPDLAQDIILVAARKYDPAGPARPLTWCFCVAKRLVLGELRKRRPEFHAELEEPAVDETCDGPGRGALDAYLEGVAGAIPASPAGRKRDRVIPVLENPGRQLDDMRRHIGVVNVGPEREQVKAEREALWTEAKACWKNGERPEADRLRDAVALRDVLLRVTADQLLAWAWTAVRCGSMNKWAGFTGRKVQDLYREKHLIVKRVRARARELANELAGRSEE